MPTAATAGAAVCFVFVPLSLFVEYIHVLMECEHYYYYDVYKKKDHAKKEHIQTHSAPLSLCHCLQLPLQQLLPLLQLTVMKVLHNQYMRVAFLSDAYCLYAAPMTPSSTQSSITNGIRQPLATPRTCVSTLCVNFSLVLRSIDSKRALTPMSTLLRTLFSKCSKRESSLFNT
jgi:hypothetical protein